MLASFSKGANPCIDCIPETKKRVYILRKAHMEAKGGHISFWEGLPAVLYLESAESAVGGPLPELLPRCMWLSAPRQSFQNLL